MTTIEERRLNFLNEKLGYFIEDPSKRAYNKETESCMYWDKSTGNKCLIGRELLEDKYDESFEGKGITYIDEQEVCIFNLLPVSIQELGLCFLAVCQRLHDENSYWNENGLSNKGKSKLKDIKDDYCNVN